MKTFRVVIKIQSSFITPFHSDTIFGSLCWALRYLKGEDALLSFLTEYQKKEPPLLISNGFPLGFLPRPILPELNLVRFREISVRKYRKDLTEIEISNLSKKFKKIKFIPDTFYQNHQKNGFSEEDVIEEYLNGKIKNYPIWKTELYYHNTINRFTEKPMEEGGFFFQEEYTFHNPDNHLSITIDTNKKNKIQLFLKGDYFSQGELLSLFQYISFSGFGKNKSTGKGKIKIVGIDEYALPHALTPNAFITLSLFVPNEKDPTKGYYQSMVKYGKLGGNLTKSTQSQYGHHPFKKPLLMFEPGSLFFCNSLNEHYGRLVKNLYLDEKVKHYAYAFPLGVRINETV